MSKPLILISNDDGINAPGIRFLAESLKTMADIVVVAPAQDQSATGLSISIRHPIRIHKQESKSFEAYAVTGTPADSVKIGLSVILKKKPDLIVSGINRGSNAGKNLLYSGTVSAVIEGCLRNIPGIAFSCHDLKDPDYSDAATRIPSIVNYALNHPLPLGTLLNVTFPSKNEGPMKGIKMVRQGKQYWIENPTHRAHPDEGESYWWLGSKISEELEHDESDIVWLKKGFVTCVPLYVAELTHHPLLLERKSHFEDYFLK